MKWLARLKSEKGLPGELPKPPKDPFDSFGGTKDRHSQEIAQPRPSPRMGEDGGIKPFCPDCFSPDGVLEAAFTEARDDGWTDEQLCNYIDALREAGALTAPWGFKVKDSPLVSEFWIISDTAARDRLPAGAKGFTLEELRPVVEAARVFEGAKVVEVRL